MLCCVLVNADNFVDQIQLIQNYLITPVARPVGMMNCNHSGAIGWQNLNKILNAPHDKHVAMCRKLASLSNTGTVWDSELCSVAAVECSRSETGNVGGLLQSRQ